MIQGSIGKGTNQTEWTEFLQRLLNQVYPSKEPIVVDGVFGPKTETRLKKYQMDSRLVVDGKAGVKTFKSLLSNIFADPSKFREDCEKFLSESQLLEISEELKVEPAVIRAIKEVESLGSGFIDNKPKILFEGHVFWDRLYIHDMDPTKIRNESNKNILHMKWTRKYYTNNEYERLDKAMEIHKEAALESCSWGLFQIMGYHWKKLGYASVFEWEEKMYKNEYEHMIAFVRFVKAYGLLTDLKNKRWSDFARKYNGPGYDTHNYDGRLRKAYERFKKNEK